MWCPGHMWLPTDTLRPRAPSNRPSLQKPTNYMLQAYVGKKSKPLLKQDNSGRLCCLGSSGNSQVPNLDPQICHLGFGCLGSSGNSQVPDLDPQICHLGFGYVRSQRKLSFIDLFFCKSYLFLLNTASIIQTLVLRQQHHRNSLCVGAVPAQGFANFATNA